MATDNTQQASSAVDVLAVLDKDLNQVFPGVRPIKATIKEESKPFEHPLETGALVTDHRIILPVDIEMSTVVAAEDYREVFRQVKDIYLRGDLLTVQTRTESYPSMLIVSIPHEESGDMQDGITLILTLREAKFVTAEFKDMKVPPPKPAAKRNADTVKRGEQRPVETPEPRKGSYLSKLDVLGRKKMIDIALQPVANQELSIPLEGSRYVITIKEANGVMAASITRDDVLIVSNTRIVADDLILPYRAQWFGFGNFLLFTQDEELPYFDQFGATQFLVYVTVDEMAAAGLV